MCRGFAYRRTGGADRTVRIVPGGARAINLIEAYS